MGELELLFCRPSRTQDALDGFETEAEVADRLGIPCHLIPIEPLVNEEPERALGGLPGGGGHRYLYRGWMLRAEEYEGLSEALEARGDLLWVQPAEYEAAAYLPEYYTEIEGHTARSAWTDEPDIDEAWALAQGLGDGPWLVKDHVKSAKEHWHRACFVPAGASMGEFQAVCDALLDLRGDRFERGFVVREFLDLKELPFRMPERPVCDEHRLVFVHGQLVSHCPYYEEGEPMDDAQRFAWLGGSIDSPFFTADVARLATGGWTIIELNDGGVSTLPPGLDLGAIYGALQDG